ncbi:MAG: desulfoferrodoxin family protein [Eubacteriales bacterium]
MASEQKFFRCKHCGNLIGMIFNSGVPIICCGEPMEELIPNTVEASNEKHLPVITISGNEAIVNIGSVDHPMIPEHYIQWIYIETKSGGQRKSLKPGDKPQAVFSLKDDELLAAYAYCNIHGLWKTQV